MCGLRKKKNDILKRYYTTSLHKYNNGFKERFFNFFKRHNFFGRLNKDIEYLELAEKALEKFQPNKIIDNDLFLERARRALVIAIVFFLYFDREPNDFDFVRVNHMLIRAKDQTQLKSFHTALDFMCAEDNKKDHDHTGRREYMVFKRSGSFQTRCMIIDNILQNFDNPAKCKKLFSEAAKELQEIRASKLPWYKKIFG